MPMQVFSLLPKGCISLFRALAFLYFVAPGYFSILLSSLWTRANTLKGVCIGNKRGDTWLWDLRASVCAGGGRRRDFFLGRCAGLWLWGLRASVRAGGGRRRDFFLGRCAGLWLWDLRASVRAGGGRKRDFFLGRCAGLWLWDLCAPVRAGDDSTGERVNQNLLQGRGEGRG
jgi:hypothetical protein